MNIILFEPDELHRLPATDARTRHILEVLRLGPGESFDAGIVNGAAGRATLSAVEEGALVLNFLPLREPAPPEPVSLIVGLPRPQTARKVLQETTSLGVRRIHFVRTERGEPGYAKSPLWSSGEWRRHVIAGAQQAFSTRIPEVVFGVRLQEALASEEDAQARLALDPYETSESLSTAAVSLPAVVAIGPERGWSEGERRLLREAGYRLVNLGDRVLRVETACIAAITLVRSRAGLL